MGMFDWLFGKKKRTSGPKFDNEKSKELEKENERYEQYLNKTFGPEKKNQKSFNHPLNGPTKTVTDKQIKNTLKRFKSFKSKNEK